MSSGYPSAPGTATLSPLHSSDFRPVFAAKCLPVQRGWDIFSSNRYTLTFFSLLLSLLWRSLPAALSLHQKGCPLPPHRRRFSKGPGTTGDFFYKKQAASQGAACLSIFFPKWGNAEGLAAAGAGALPLQLALLVGPLAHLLQKGVVGGGGPPEERGGERLHPLSRSPPAPAAEPPAGRGSATPAGRAGDSPSAAVADRIFPLLCSPFPPSCPLARAEWKST